MLIFEMSNLEKYDFRISGFFLSFSCKLVSEHKEALSMRDCFLFLKILVVV